MYQRRAGKRDKEKKICLGQFGCLTVCVDVIVAELGCGIGITHGMSFMGHHTE